jgi:phage-related tail protein
MPARKGRKKTSAKAKKKGASSATEGVEGLRTLLFGEANADATAAFEDKFAALHYEMKALEGQQQVSAQQSESGRLQTQVDRLEEHLRTQRALMRAHEAQVDAWDAELHTLQRNSQALCEAADPAFNVI